MNLWCYELTAEKLLNQTLRKRLTAAGYNYTAGEKYLYAPGTTPILITAHVDTVHRTTPEVVYDKKRRILWSPDGIGGDDRTGVAAIIQLLEWGYRPHVLFCDLEESGCQGSSDAVVDLDPPDIKYIIGLDRKNRKDAVYYNCRNTEFKKYINNFGFETATGTLSDISVLCPAWNIAGVNLSMGFYNPHRKTEYIRLEHWEETVLKLAEMLENPPEELFEYGYRVKTKTTTTAKEQSNKYMVGEDGTVYAVDSKYVRSAHNGYNQNTTRNYNTQRNKNKSYTYKGPFSVGSKARIKAEYLAEKYGSTEDVWRGWLKEHREEIEEVAEEALHAKVSELALLEPPEEIFEQNWEGQDE